jgi:hypothetical protein
LKGKLDLLTQDDPPLDPLVDIEYIVLRRFNKSRNWFDADFVDGDKVDNKQWFEGSFHSQTTVRELFAKKHRYSRKVRRGISGKKKVPLGESSSDTSESDSSSKSSSSEEETSSEEQKGSELESDGTEEYEQSAAPAKEPEILDLENDYDDDDRVCESSSVNNASSEYEASRQRGDRRGGYRSAQIRPSGVVSAPIPEPKRESELIPRMADLKWERGKEWKERFRESVQPSVPGVDAAQFFEYERRKRKREQDMSDLQEKRDEDHNPKTKGDGSPVPRWWLDREAERREHLMTLNVREKAKWKAARKAEKGVCGKHSEKRRKADPVLMTTVTGEETEDGLALHPMDHVGIDTCSARSVSSEIADFLYLDTSVRAINSVELNGVGNGFEPSSWPRINPNPNLEP